MERKNIELLAPAGDMERLEMAVAYGADAVYLAGWPPASLQFVLIVAYLIHQIPNSVYRLKL